MILLNAAVRTPSVKGAFDGAVHALRRPLLPGMKGPIRTQFRRSPPIRYRYDPFA
ncbi:MAG: hypothetical protein OJF62_000823 [Pseudolabrys sp.]|nr:hypothetical protein [Pseudolabrys sp.]